MRGTSLIAGVVGLLLLAGQPCIADNLELPPGPGRELVYGQCRTCHDLQYLIESAGVPRSTWSDLLDSMKQYGLRIPPDQRAKILDYLGTYLGPNPPKASAASAPAQRPKKPTARPCSTSNARPVISRKARAWPGSFRRSRATAIFS